jgi:hypothetical protein
LPQVRRILASRSRILLSQDRDQGRLGQLLPGLRCGEAEPDEIAELHATACIALGKTVYGDESMNLIEENEKLRGLLRDVIEVVEGRHLAPGLVIARVRNTLSRQPEPACSACNGDCSAANPPVMNCPQHEPAPAQDGREAFEQHPNFRGMDFTRAETHQEYYASPYANGALDGWMAGRAAHPSQAEQQPAGYIRASDLDRLAPKHVAGCAASLRKEPGEGWVAIYAAPIAQPEPSGYTAVDMASAAAQGFRDGRAELVEALTDLLHWAEHQVCEHDSTHRGGAIWEICDNCGAKWADDQGGKPELKWPAAIERARAALCAQEAQ